MALVLMLTLASAALAEGKVDCPGVTPPPPDEITNETQSDGEPDSTLAEVLLTLIEGVFLVP
jgi:hypothetical protein